MTTIGIAVLKITVNQLNNPFIFIVSPGCGNPPNNSSNDTSV